MFSENKEKGYALIIVLFSIVLITTITAAFMRGALSNVAQEKTVDENNLVVVAAESGIDYYTYELKKAYDKVQLQSIVDENVEAAIAKNNLPIDYNNIHAELVNKVMENIILIEGKIKTFQLKDSYDMADDFVHELILPLEIKSGISKGEQFIKVSADVKGEQKSKSENNRSLHFDLLFTIPPLTSSEDSENNDTVEITIPTIECKKTIEIEDENKPCLFKKNKTSELKSIDESKVYINEDYSGWKEVEIDDSYLYMKNFKNGAKWDVESSDLVVEGNLSKHSNFDLEDSKLFIRGNFTESGKIDFDESHITIDGEFKVSTGESEIEESLMLVGSDFHSPNKIVIQKSHLTIGGRMLFNSGGTFQDSFLKVRNELEAPSKLETQNTDIKIGKHLKLDSGGDFQKTKIIVGSYVKSPSPFNVQNSQIVIGGDLTLNSKSEWQGNTTIKVDGKLDSPNKIDIQDSTVITKNTDVGELNLQNTKYCAEEFKVDYSFNMDSSSKIYYLNTTNRTGNNIKKLTREEFDAQCSYSLAIEDPKLPIKPKMPGDANLTPNSPSSINWDEYDPKLKKVTY